MLANNILLNVAKFQHVKLDMKIKSRIITRHCFVSINILQRVIIYILSYDKDFETRKNEDVLKKSPQAINFKKDNLKWDKSTTSTAHQNGCLMRNSRFFNRVSDSHVPSCRQQSCTPDLSLSACCLNEKANHASVTLTRFNGMFTIFT